MIMGPSVVVRMPPSMVNPTIRGPWVVIRLGPPMTFLGTPMTMGPSMV